MKTYLVFLNEPNAEIFDFMAESKREALNQYNQMMKTNFKIKKEGYLWIVEKRAWYNYDFRKVSCASQS